VQQRSPAQRCAVFFGVLLVAVGIVGFFYNGTFTSNERIHDDMLGAFSVNGWSNTLHILLGILGLAVASSWSGARAFCYGAGLLLVALGVWGFILGAGQSILSIIPVNAAIDWARLVIGVILAFAAVWSSPDPNPSTLGSAS
jgi:Domain of unknown function (DUF4383)